MPGTGRKKPSVSGTLVNGKALTAPATLTGGDSLQIGPWVFALEDDQPQPAERGAIQVLALEKTDARFKAGYAHLHDLHPRLHRASDHEGILQAILEFALEKIPAAEVAAVLVFGPDQRPAVRMALQRGVGRTKDFRFSSGLVQSLPPGEAFLLRAAMPDPTKSQIEQNITSGLLIPLTGNRGRLGLLYLDNRHQRVPFADADPYLANALCGLVGLQLTLEAQALESRLESAMRRHFGREGARRLVEESRNGIPWDPVLRACEVTLLFVDLHDFDSCCGARTPREVGELLHPYFQTVFDGIKANGGHVDAFIRGGVLGVFGAMPRWGKGTDGPNHAVSAARAARDILGIWSEYSRNRWGKPVALRAGIHTGQVLLGQIGCPDRQDYAVLGPAVPIALELAKSAPADIIALSEASHALLGREFSAEDGRAKVPGAGSVRLLRPALGP